MQVRRYPAGKDTNMIRGNIFRACALAEIALHALYEQITGFSETSPGGKNHPFFNIYTFGAGCIAAAAMAAIVRFRKNGMKVSLYFPGIKNIFQFVMLLCRRGKS